MEEFYLVLKENKRNFVKRCHEQVISETNLDFHNVATRAPRWPGPTTKSSDVLVFSMTF